MIEFLPFLLGALGALGGGVTGSVIWLWGYKTAQRRGSRLTPNDHVLRDVVRQRDRFMRERDQLIRERDAEHARDARLN